MKLTTLNYIHEVLQHNVVTKRTVRRTAYDAWRKAENDGADNADFFLDGKNMAYQAWRTALQALEDFEAQEW